MRRLEVGPKYIADKLLDKKEFEMVLTHYLAQRSKRGAVEGLVMGIDSLVESIEENYEPESNWENE